MALISPAPSPHVLLKPPKRGRFVHVHTGFNVSPERAVWRRGLGDLAGQATSPKS
jgi:hypothetical protein